MDGTSLPVVGNEMPVTGNEMPVTGNEVPIDNKMPILGAGEHGSSATAPSAGHRKAPPPLSPLSLDDRPYLPAGQRTNPSRSRAAV
jgi:hypothetical protein